MQLNIFQKYPRAWWAGGAAIVLLIMLLGLTGGWIYVTDWPITYGAAALRNDFLTEYVMKSISCVVYPAILLVFSIVVAAFFRKKEVFWVLFINVVCIEIINRSLKLLFNRPRPFVQDNSIFLVNETATSFPSGHAMCSVAFFGLVIFLIWSYTREKPLRMFWSFFLGFMIFMVMFSRVYLGVHFASDVTAGACFSILWLCAYTKWVVPAFIGKPKDWVDPTPEGAKAYVAEHKQ